jgi:dTDP-4-dehydrorhamnose reductase
MKVLVTGALGQLGQEVCNCLRRIGISYKGVDLVDFDLTDEQATLDAIRSYQPDGVIHCAAYTAVDKAESEKELCYRINVTGTTHVAKACKDINAKMIYISTDYVFDGLGDIPFETDSPIAPVNYYGLTKAQGETEVISRLEKFFIVRTSWVFGLGGNNFVKTMLRLGKQQESVRVVGDQIGSPTYVGDLAPLLCEMIQTEKYGVYHATNEGYCSWYEFACEIMRQANLSCRIEMITTKEYPTAARRPYNSRLSKESLDIGGFNRLTHWQDALRRYLDLNVII